jgi:hypothetical protein
MRAVRGERRVAASARIELDNLIVLGHEPLSGTDIARAMALPWLIVVLLTVGFGRLPAGTSGARVVDRFRR